MEGDHEQCIYTLDENSWKREKKSYLRANLKKRMKYLLWMGLKFSYPQTTNL